MKRVNIGIIGTGSNAELFMEACYQNHMECLAVCTKNETTGRKFADLFYVDDLYTNTNEFLKRRDFDFVFVAVKNIEVVIECLEANHNVVVYNQFSTNEEKVLRKIANEHHVFYIDADHLRKYQELTYLYDETHHLTKVLKINYDSSGERKPANQGTLLYEYDTITGCIINENLYMPNTLYEACREIKEICQTNIM